MKPLRLLLGWWRLRFRFCPECNSSPPDPHCYVCEGDIFYGRAADYRKRLRWRNRFRSGYTIRTVNK